MSDTFDLNNNYLNHAYIDMYTQKTTTNKDYIDTNKVYFVIPILVKNSDCYLITGDKLIGNQHILNYSLIYDSIKNEKVH